MTIKDLIENGNDAIADALDDMNIIINGDGCGLIGLGGDSLGFSPNLECEPNRSTIIFNEPSEARRVIEEILKPQEDGEYQVFRFTKTVKPKRGKSKSKTVEFTIS